MNVNLLFECMKRSYLLPSAAHIEDLQHIQASVEFRMFD